MHQCLAHFGTLFICLNDGMLVLSCSVVPDSSATPWTVAHQAPLSMGFPRQEYWSGLPFPSPGDLPNPRIKPTSPVLAGKLFINEPPGKSPPGPEAKPKPLEVAAAVDCQTEGQICPWGPFTLGFKTTLKGWSARADKGISALKEL